MPRIHLVIGPVGAGKSTFASTLSHKHGALRLTLDEWMATLFRPDRPQQDVIPWYTERAERCLSQIQRVASAALAVGVDCVLEVGLIRQAERAAFYERLQGQSIAYTVYLLDAPRETRRQRVMARNLEQGPTFSMVVPPEVFELASDLWEPPDESERRSQGMHCIAAV